MANSSYPPSYKPYKENGSTKGASKKKIRDIQENFEKDQQKQKKQGRISDQVFLYIEYLWSLFCFYKNRRICLLWIIA